MEPRLLLQIDDLSVDVYAAEVVVAAMSRAHLSRGTSLNAGSCGHVWHNTKAKIDALHKQDLDPRKVKPSHPWTPYSQLHGSLQAYALGQFASEEEEEEA